MTWLTLLAWAGVSTGTSTYASLPADRFPTPEGDVTVAFLGHGSLLFVFNGRHIYVDPWSEVGDFRRLPKADLVLITHDHYDHYDPAALKWLRAPETRILAGPSCAGKITDAVILKPGETRSVESLVVEAVPAYNRLHRRPDGRPFHPKGEGVGFVLSFAGVRFYVAGDTEPIPEMNGLTSITAAFLPMNLPYTMTPEMVAEAARRFKPRFLYPYHYGETDPAELVRLLQNTPEIEVRVRPMR